MKTVFDPLLGKIKTVDEKEIETIIREQYLASGASGGGSNTWGSITGTLSAQTDLQTALDAKVPYIGATADLDLGAFDFTTTGGVTAELLTANNSININNGGAANFFSDAGVTTFGQLAFNTLGKLSISNDSFDAVIDTTALTGNREYDLPNASGTLALTENTGHVAFGANADIDGTGQVNSILQDILGVGTASSVVGIQETMTGTPTVYSTGLQIKTVANFGSGATSVFGIEAMSATLAGNAQNVTLMGGFFGGVAHRGTGTIGTAYGVPGAVYNESSGIISDALGLLGIVNNTGLGTITRAVGMQVNAAGNSGGGTITTLYGGYIQAQTVGTSSYTLALEASTTGTLWIGSLADPTTAAGGIYFGVSKDTNLYRSAASTLKTDDSLIVGTNLTVTGTSLFSDDLTIGDAQNIILDSTTGTKIGTATTQKLGFFNAAPVTQQGATVEIGTVLSNLGFRAAGTAFPITTSGAISFTGGATISGATVSLNASSNFATNINTGTSSGLTTIGNSLNSLSIKSNTFGVYSATPVAQSTDWNVIGDLTERKTLDLTSVSLTELAEYVATLTKKLHEYTGNGILGAGYVPPDIGWSHFWTAETMTGGGASATNWTPVKGNVTLTRAGTSTVETDASFGGKNWIDMDALGDYFYSPDASMTQDYVIVAYIRMTGIPTNSSASIFESYTDGTLPTDRAFAYYIDTTIDQQRMNAGTQVQANWAGDFTTKLWEICFAGASSYWKRDGVTTVSGNAGTNAGDGFVIGARYDLTSNQNDKIEICYVGLISKTNWDANRAAFVAWHNERYTEDAV